MTIKIIALVFSVIAVFLIVIRVAIKNRDRGADRLSVFEHPSVFKKPDIEMVNYIPEKTEKPDASTEPEQRSPDNSDDR